MLLLLQKAWLAVKKFWYVPVLLVVAVILAVVYRKNTSVIEMLYNTLDSYKEQAAKLDKLNKEQLAQKEDLQKKYNLVLQQMIEQHEHNEQVLTEERKKRIKELVEQYKGKDEELAKAFSQEFGIDLK